MPGSPKLLRLGLIRLANSPEFSPRHWENSMLYLGCLEVRIDWNETHYCTRSKLCFHQTIQKGPLFKTDPISSQQNLRSIRWPNVSVSTHMWQVFTLLTISHDRKSQKEVPPSQCDKNELPTTCSTTVIACHSGWDNEIFPPIQSKTHPTSSPTLHSENDPFTTLGLFFASLRFEAKELTRLL